MAVEWPKRWSDIREGGPDDRFVSSSVYVNIGDALRIHDGTLYVNADAGEETDENPDFWVPFDLYLRSRGDV